MSEADVERAAELFAQHGSVNAVAKAMEISYYAAQKLLGRESPSKLAPKKGGASKKKSRKAALAVRDAESAAEEEPEDLEISLRMPTARVDEMLQGLSRQEKYDALGYVLQRRLDVALGLES